MFGRKINPNLQGTDEKKIENNKEFYKRIFEIFLKSDDVQLNVYISKNFIFVERVFSMYRIFKQHILST